MGILSDVLDSEEAIQDTLKEILEQWRKAQATAAEDEVAKTSDKLGKIDIVEKMNMITQQKLANYVPKKQEEQTEEQKKMKEAILLGYGEAALSDDEDGEEAGGGGGGDLSLSVSKITRVSNTVGGLEAIDNAASSHAEQVTYQFSVNVLHTCTHAHMHTCTHAHMHTCTHVGGNEREAESRLFC